MNSKNLIIYVSSRNNYDMLEGEVLNNINTEGFEFINVDDGSSDEEIDKGKKICAQNNIVFLENKSRGVQMATQTLIDFVNKNRPECKWVICFQHDNYPISKNFFTEISNLISKDKLNNFGILGFNNLDYGSYTGDSLQEFKKGNFPLGMIGMAHLTILDRESRWLAPKRQPKLLQNPLWKKPFIVEWPMGASQGINVDLWNKYITPTTDYEFFLWGQDIAMQFTYKGYPCLILPHLYCFNHQDLKTKYNINANSAHGAKNGQEYHFGKYSNFEAWTRRWGWHYEDPKPGLEQVIDNYKNTLIWDFFYHDITKGPLKNIEL